MIFVASSNDRLFILKILWVAWAMLGGFCTLYVIAEVTYIVTIYIYIYICTADKDRGGHQKAGPGKGKENILLKK